MTRRRRRDATGGVYLRGKTYWCNYRSPAGERVFESCGTRDRREAQAFLAGIKRSLRDGTWVHPKEREGSTAPTTVRAYAARWIERRRGLGVRNVGDEERWVHQWLVAEHGDRPIAEITKADIRAAVHTMRTTPSELTGRPYAPRTIRSAYEAIRVMFADALDDEEIVATPCTLSVRKRELPTKRDADPRWRSQSVYTRDEAETLISDERIPLDRRVYYGLQLLGGVRASEAAGLRWRDLDMAAEPLWHLLVATQASGTDEERRTKTGDVKDVAVHPSLRKLLTRWRVEGFALRFKRHPEPGHFIVPSRRGPEIARTKTALRRLKQDLGRLGLRAEGRGRHSMRSTMLTLAEIDGCNMSILARMTHRTPMYGGALSGYLRPGFEALCAEVVKLKIELRQVADVVSLEHRRAASDRVTGDITGDNRSKAGDFLNDSVRGDWIRNGPSVAKEGDFDDFAQTSSTDGDRDRRENAHLATPPTQAVTYVTDQAATLRRMLDAATSEDERAALTAALEALEGRS